MHSPRPFPAFELPTAQEGWGLGKAKFACFDITASAGQCAIRSIPGTDVVMKYQFGFALTLALASLSTSARAVEGAGGFIRVEAGKGNFDVAGKGFSAFGTNSPVRGSDRDNSLSVRGGYFFNAYMGVEGFYSNYGEGNGEDRIGVIRGGDEPVEYISLNRVAEKVAAIGLGVVGKTDFGGDSRGVYINGRAGFVRAKTDVRWTSFSYAEDWHTTKFSDTSTKPYVGMGLGYDFTPNFGLSLNCDWTKAELAKDSIEVSAKLQTLTLGAEFRF